VGTPAVTCVVVGLCCWCLYIWYLNPDATLLGFAALAAMGWTHKANSEVARYRAWKRAWDSLAPGGPPRRRTDHPAFQVAVVAMLAIAMGVYLDAHRDQPGYELALAWLEWGGIALLIGSLAVLRHRSPARPIWRRRRPSRHADPVSVCVRGPLIQVPDLKGAYGALPRHCWVVINAR
jgi:hypothetical protein